MNLINEPATPGGISLAISTSVGVFFGWTFSPTTRHDDHDIVKLQRASTIRPPQTQTQTLFLLRQRVGFAFVPHPLIDQSEGTRFRSVAGQLV